MPWTPPESPDANGLPETAESIPDDDVNARTPVPKFEIWKVCGVGFKFEAPKKFKLVGATDITAVFTASVTGIEIGEFVAPGADSVIVAL